MRLIPAPRGTGLVAASVPKKLLHMAGVQDCYTSARGQTATLGNFGQSQLWLVGVYICFMLVKIANYQLLRVSRVSPPTAAKATFAAITNTYTYLTPDLWSDMKLTKPPYQEHTDFLAMTQKQQVPLPRPAE